jgi:excinuclease UvrABC nuclease subunit
MTPLHRLTTSLAREGWRTPDSYTGCFGSIPDSSGVYLLDCVDLELYKSKIYYVGQARSLVRRLNGHEILALLRRHPAGFFVRRWFRLFDVAELRKVERSYIEFFDPPYNIIGRLRGHV